MAVVENRFVCDISKPVQAQALKGNVFSLDNLGSRLSVLIYDNSQPATISGSITANCILPDGSTVNVNGSLTTENGGSKAYVDVPQSCLLIPGILKIAIKCTSSSVITTLAAIVANVYMTKTDNVITPSQQIIDDWNAAISSAIATQNATIDAAIATQNGQISELKSAVTQNGVFSLSNTSGTNLQNYAMYPFYANEGDVLTVLVNREGTLTSINLLATYADGTTGTLQAINSTNYNKNVEVTLSKGLKAIGAYLPANYGSASLTIFYGANKRTAIIDNLKSELVYNGEYPLVNTSGSNLSNYNMFPFYANSGDVLTLYAKTSSASPTGINVLATYADGTTGTLQGINSSSYNKNIDVTLAKDLVAIGEYTPANYHGATLYIYYGTSKRTAIESKSAYDYAVSGYNGTDSYVFSNTGSTNYQNYNLFEFHAKKDMKLYFALAENRSDGVNILATYEDGTTGILVSNVGKLVKPKIVEATVSKDIKALGLWIPKNYAENTLYMLSPAYGSLKKEFTNAVFEKDAFGTFAKFGVCGDSLSVGYMSDSEETAHDRNIYYSWGQVLARRYGNCCLNFGFSGATTGTWYTNATHGKVELVQADNKCQAYVIGLGVNDGTSDIGSASDINLSDYTQNADTFYGRYGKIIQTILEFAPTAYIFVLTIPGTDVLNRYNADKNNAIKGVVTKINSDQVFLIDTIDYVELFNSDFITDNAWKGHYTAIGYENIASVMAIALSDCMNKNASKLKDIAFVPYGSNTVIN